MPGLKPCRILEIIDHIPVAHNLLKIGGIGIEELVAPVGPGDSAEMVAVQGADLVADEFPCTVIG